MLTTQVNFLCPQFAMHLRFNVGSKGQDLDLGMKDENLYCQEEPRALIPCKRKGRFCC